MNSVMSVAMFSVGCLCLWADAAAATFFLVAAIWFELQRKPKESA